MERPRGLLRGEAQEQTEVKFSKHPSPAALGQTTRGEGGLTGTERGRDPTAQSRREETAAWTRQRQCRWGEAAGLALPLEGEPVKGKVKGNAAFGCEM